MGPSSSDSFGLPRPSSSAAPLEDASSASVVRPAARRGDGDESRTRRFEQLLLDAGRRLGEVNAVHQVALESQREAMGRFQDAQQEMLERFQRVQDGTIQELRRVQEEFSERARETLVRARVALVGSCAALAASCAMLLVSVHPAGPSVASGVPAPAPAAERRAVATQVDPALVAPTRAPSGPSPVEPTAMAALPPSARPGR